jgi:DNA-directed RNA polymerase specialized sigma24 family protein
MSSRVAEFVPADYTEFYNHYRTYLLRIMRSSGILEDEVEDVAHTILIKFIQHDVLKDFDPDYTTVYKGQVRKARFSTFLSGFVYKYLRHHKEMQDKRLQREPVIMDTPASDDSGETLGDFLAPAQPLDVDDFETLEALSSIRAQLCELEIPSRSGRMDLPLFFDLILIQVEEHGRVDTKELAELFSVSTTTIREWLQRIRPFFQEAFTS